MCTYQTLDTSVDFESLANATSNPYNSCVQYPNDACFSALESPSSCAQILHNIDKYNNQNYAQRLLYSMCWPLRTIQ